MSASPTAPFVVALGRGAPARRLIGRAVVLGALARLAGVALVGGAAGLLTWSASRPGVAAVAGLLVAVELVAFLRAPLRHAERVASHDLGLDGLAGWRTWLLDSVATWAPSRLAAARSGDLLARCVDDADQLQDLWVRILVPAAASVVALAAAAVVLGALDPLAGLGLAGATVVVGAATWARARKVAALGRLEASARGVVAARAVEFARTAAALRLLGADAVHRDVTESLARRADRLAVRRDAVVSRLCVLAAVAAAVAVVAAAIGATVPTSHPGVVAGVLLGTLAGGELLVGLPVCLEAVGPVAGAAARLDGLAEATTTGDVVARVGALALRDVDVAPAAEGPVLLEGVDLEVTPSSCVAVTGPTGSGKSSLLAVAAGLEHPRRGVVTLDGAELGTLDEPSLRTAVGWLPTHPTLLEGRVRDVLDLGRGLGDDALSRALDDVGLTAALAARGGLDASVGVDEHDLSGGERRRLALARLLAASPHVLVLDEPSAGVDDVALGRVLDAVVGSGAAVLVATHDERITSRATQVVRVADGTVEPERA